MVYKTTILFLQFLRRDFYQYKRELKRYTLNFGMLRPFWFAIGIAYLQANVMFVAGQKEIGMFFLTGNALLVLMVLTFSLNAKLIFDLEGNRFVEYQILMLKPRWLLMEKMLFSTLFTTMIMAPFFPIAKLLLGNYLVMNNPSWVSLYIVMLFGALCLSAYNIMVGSILRRSDQILSLWMRVNIPMLILGGLWVPFYVVKTFIPWASVILYANPILYVTEGFRRAAMGDTRFLSISTCCAALFLGTIIFMFFAFYFFKKRVDHV